MAPINKKLRAAMLLTKFQKHRCNVQGESYEESSNYQEVTSRSNITPYRDYSSDSNLISTSPNSESHHTSSHNDHHSHLDSPSSPSEDNCQHKLGRLCLDKNSEEYRLRRERNNIAVRKSRSKSKLKFIQTMERINQLEDENKKLHERVESMGRELTILKYLLVKHANESHGGRLSVEEQLAAATSSPIADDGFNILFSSK